MTSFTLKHQNRSVKTTISFDSSASLLAAISKETDVPLERLKIICKGKVVKNGQDSLPSGVFVDGAVVQVIGQKREDETGCDPRDIDVIMKQMHVSREEAVRALKANDFDLITAMTHI